MLKLNKNVYVLNARSPAFENCINRMQKQSSNHVQLEHSNKMSKRKSDDEDCSKTKRLRERTRCNYCFRDRELVLEKPYCVICALNSVECRICHHPLPDRLVENGVCCSCRRKEQRQHQTGLGGAAFIARMLPNNHGNIDPLTTLSQERQKVSDELKEKLIELNGIKWYVEFTVKMIKYDRNGEEITADVVFRGETEILLTSQDIDDQYDKQIDLIMRLLRDWVKDGSGWSVQNVEDLLLYMAQYKPLSPTSFIKTPKYIEKKHAIINVKNEDNMCFVWAVLAALFPKKGNPNRILQYKEHLNSINIDGLTFPLPITDVKKFEKLNLNISVNVLAYDGKTTIYPIYVTSDTKRQHHVNLLILTENFNSHYCTIINMSRLLKQPNDYNHRKFYCNYCLHGYLAEETLKRHVVDCSKLGMQKVLLPDNDEKYVSFEAIHKMQPMAFVIYCDFECYTAKLQGPTNKNQSTQLYEMHVPSGFAYLVVCSDQNRMFEPVVYRGPDVVHEFLKKMVIESENINKILKSEAAPINITAEEQQAFKLTENCYLCDSPMGVDRVRDHDHLTGRYRGAAHCECNLKLQFPADKRNGKITIPIIFHNLRGYDGHLILKSFQRELFDEGKIKCIPNNMEKYISFSIDNLLFIDSLQFMNESLEKLVKNLNVKDFIHTRRHTPTENKFQLLIRKGVYPYDYVDGPDKMSEQQLPPREAFFNRLTEEHISEADYAHALRVWEEFEILNIGEYHDLYLKTDVLLLADTFEQFRAVCLKNYKLDAAYYYSSPGLAWDAMLKMTKVRLELMQDREMHCIVDKGIRGGICCISRKHAAANNPLIEETFDPSKPTSFILYLDMNNLYGAAMIEPPPEKEFDFLLDEQIASFDLMSVPDDGPIGYILEVDIDYPSELHDTHNDYPLCPVSQVINIKDLSPYTISLANKLGIKPTGYKKLIANLQPKERYSVHYRTLKLYVKLGMKITKIHRIISFTQSRWLKKYIDFNTEQRKNAKNEFEKNFFKLMNNSVFGKTMENIRKHQRVELVPDGHRFKRLACKPNFKSFKIFSSDLVAVHMTKTVIKLTKPTYVGLSILDLSKSFMFAFHYENIVKKYGERSKLLMTDTDSLVYFIETADVYKDMLDDLDSYDTSDYPKTHFAYSEKNKKVLGKMKDEYNGCPVKEFVGLRPKMYSIMDANNDEKRTAKGISRRSTASLLRHQTYYNALYSETSSTVTMQQIRSIGHTLYSMSLTKTGLSPYDDKRYVLSDKISTLAFGHYKINSSSNRDGEGEACARPPSTQLPTCVLV